MICGDLNTAHKEIELTRPKDNALSSGFLPEEHRWIDKVVKNYISLFLGILTPNQVSTPTGI